VTGGKSEGQITFGAGTNRVVCGERLSHSQDEKTAETSGERPREKARHQEDKARLERKSVGTQMSKGWGWAGGPHRSKDNEWVGGRKRYGKGVNNLGTKPFKQKKQVWDGQGGKTGDQWEYKEGGEK